MTKEITYSKEIGEETKKLEECTTLTKKLFKSNFISIINSK